MEMTSGGEPSSPTIKSGDEHAHFRQPWHITLAYSIFNLSMATSMSFIMAILMPSQIIEMVGDTRKAEILGTITMCAAVMYTIGGPFTGFLSDYVTKKTRIPFVVVGTLFWVTSIMVRPLIVHLYLKNETNEARNTLFLGYVLVTAFGKFFYAVATTPFIALLPDFFPKEQYNSISAAIGCSSLFGLFIGVVLMGAIYRYILTIWSCTIVCSLVLLSMIFLYPFRRENNLDYRIKHFEEKSLLREESDSSDSETEKETANRDDNLQSLPPSTRKPLVETTPETAASSEQPSRDIFTLALLFITSIGKPFKSWNFSWIFATRFIMTLGNSSIKAFFLYFIRDTMQPYNLFGWKNFPRTDEQAQSIYMAIAFFFSVFSSLSSGYLANWFGRRMVVFISGILCALASAIMVCTMEYNIFLLCGVIMGLGVGAYISVDLALVNLVLPSEDERAKDLAIWNISQNIPDLIAAPLFGKIISIGNAMYASHQVPIRGFGYVLQYSISIALFILTSGFIWCVYLPDDTMKLGRMKTNFYQNTQILIDEQYANLSDSEEEEEKQKED